MLVQYSEASRCSIHGVQRCSSNLCSAYAHSNKIKKSDRVEYDGPNRISLKESNRFPCRENLQTLAAPALEIFYPQIKIRSTRGSTPDLWCAAEVLRPAELALK